MTIQQLIQLAIDNILYTVLITVIGGFLIIRIFKTARMYLGAKQYVRKATKLDKKKFNGMMLIDKTQRKRKRGSNSYNKLRRGSKNKVIRYFEHKLEELPVLCRFKHGKLFKRSKREVIIIIRRNKKVLKKITSKKNLKTLIQVTNKYECLNEMIIFLHNLPEAILEEQEYDIYIGEDDIQITYKLK